MLETNQIVSFFADRHIILKKKWLDEVIQYLKHENKEATTLEAASICDQIYEQWLFSELSLSTRPSLKLPPYEKKILVENQCALQVNWILDIGESLYSQFRSLVNHFDDNSGFDCNSMEDNHGERKARSDFLFMEVTDGQRRLHAISMGNIDGLNAKCISGIKIYLFSNVQCRRNLLLLSGSNTQVLGGDVETLCVSNDPVHVMARRLNIDESRILQNSNGTKMLLAMETYEDIGEGNVTDIDHTVKMNDDNGITGTKDISIPSKQSCANISEEIGKDEAMDAGGGVEAMTIARGDGVGAQMDTTVPENEPKYAANVTNEVINFAPVCVTSDNQKANDGITSATREDYEKPSIIRMQDRIALAIIPHKKFASETIGEKEQIFASKSENCKPSAWDKRTLDETVLKEITSKLKRNNEKKKNNTATIGMRPITSYFAPVRKLREPQSQNKAVINPPVGSNAVINIDSIKQISPTQRFQTVSSGLSNRSLIDEDKSYRFTHHFPTCENFDRSSSRPVPVFEDAGSNGQVPGHETMSRPTFQRIPDLESTGGPVYDEVQRLEDTGQVPVLEDLDRPSCDHTEGLKCINQSGYHQLRRQVPVFKNPDRPPHCQDRTLDELDQPSCGQLQVAGNSAARLSQVPQRSSAVNATSLPTIATRQHPNGSFASKNSFFGKLLMMRKREMNSIQSSAERQSNVYWNTESSNCIETEVERRAQLGGHTIGRGSMQVDVEKDRTQSSQRTMGYGKVQSNVRVQTEANEHAIRDDNTEGSSIVFRCGGNMQEGMYSHLTSNSKDTTVWDFNAVGWWKTAETNNEMSNDLKGQHDDNGIIPTIWNRTQRNTQMNFGQIGTSIQQTPKADNKMAWMSCRHLSSENHDIRDGCAYSTEGLSQERLLLLDDRRAFTALATTRPVIQVPPMQNIGQFQQQMGMITPRLPSAPKKRQLGEQFPSTESTRFKTLQSRVVVDHSSEPSPQINKVLVMKSNATDASSSKTSSRPFTLFHQPTTTAGRLSSNRNDYEIITRFNRLHITTLAEVHHCRAFWMIAQRKRIQPISCEVVGSLQVWNEVWLVNVLVTDHTARDMFCAVENDVIERLLGFSFQECKRLYAAREMKRLMQHKKRASTMLQVFSRLDLVLTIEFSPSADVIPLIVDVTNLASALGIC